MSYEHDVRD